ncbi:hypothetical protein [Caminibacter pacificus]|uniref:Type II and III secretion system protein n=1 Tax=Caminibacter pacificus TaxID=1424653 RepID=A0AAJ4UX70_9BACT|nr:hypothetical protein [Caminibacter pacificus]QDD68142.1 hypothetical protein C6V80_09825 [Caminibacter pacificus]ROR38760.1 hypothetical protein EDC58_1975 [Caminibacter pacificus]
MKKVILSTTAVLILFSGCAKEINNEYTQDLGYNVYHSEKIKTQNEKLFKNMQKKGDNAFLDLSITQTLSSALAKIGEINKRVYILEGEDITLKKLPLYASKQIRINNFQKLKKYIEDTTPYTIKIVKNKYLKNAPKVVKVFDKKALKSSLSKTPFALSGDIKLKDALSLLSSATGFSVVTDGNVDIDNAGISLYFKGRNVAEFLSYLQNMLNVFIDVDYSSKIIKLSKYKTQTFQLIMPSITEESTFNVSNNFNTAEKKDNKELTDIINAIKSVVGGNGSVISHNGDLIVKTTYKNMQIIQKIIQQYNKSFEKQVKLRFEIYKFLLSKDYNYGIDLNINAVKNNPQTLVTNYINSVIYKRGNILVGSDNNFINFYKQYSFTKMLTNGIPQTIALTNKKNYVKSVTVTTTTGTATTSQVSTEVDTLTQGQILDIVPKIYGNKVFLRTIFETTTLNNMDSVKEGDTTLNLPDTSQSLLTDSSVFNFGDRKLIGLYQTYEDLNSFKGVVPNQNFIIGGARGDKYVRELIAVVVTVEKP